jgi:hypothetical protein
MSCQPLTLIVAGIAAVVAGSPSGHAQSPVIPPHSPPFTTTLSNTTPLAFGMDEATTAAALGVPLNYISGRPGNEIFLAFRTYGGSGFFERKDRLYLQFRRGRLAGWKGDWGRNWMWR